MTIEKDCGKNFQLFFEEEWKKEKLKIESIIWNETKEVIGFLYPNNKDVHNILFLIDAIKNSYENHKKSIFKEILFTQHVLKNEEMLKEYQAIYNQSLIESYKSSMEIWNLTK